jgi:site-specific recombinase XerD
MTAPITSFAETNLQLVEAFDRFLEARGHAVLTRRVYRSASRAFVHFLRDASVGSADLQTVREYMAWLCSRGLSSRTIRKDTAALRALFQFLQLSGLAKSDPTRMLTHRKIAGRSPRVLTVDEIDRLLDAADGPVERAVIEFLYATGVRVSELVAMRVDDVDLETRTARVKNGKGGKDRVVLFGRKAVDALREMFEARPTQAGFLFESHHCPTRIRPYGTSAIHGLVARVGRRAKLGRVHPHALRRAFATHMLDGGADLRVVQDLLGHDQLSTTMLYTNLSGASLKKTHSNCHPRGGYHREKN